MQGGDDPTTRSLLRGAREELADVGQGAFTMDGVSKRSFFSPGAVYERWSERGDLIADVGVGILAELDDVLRATTDVDDVIACTLEEHRALLGLAGEILVAGHTMPAVHGVATDMWSTLLDGIEAHLPRGMAWYVACMALGGPLLEALDLPGPVPARGRVAWLREACRTESDDHHIAGHGVQHGKVTVPQVPGPSRTDPTAQALIQAAQTLLAERGAIGLSTREVSSSAGVTTGAMYRRYGGKAALLADVLLAELAPDRYAWTWRLIEALATDDPYWAAADVITQQLLDVAQDVASQRVLLQLGIAARTDEPLRDLVHERVRAAHSARTELFARLQVAGVVRLDVDPAVFAWSFQTLPVGMRAVTPLGIPLDEGRVTASMRAAFTAAATR